MLEEASRSDAVGILLRRYVSGDVRRTAAVERERTDAEVAQLIHDRRVAAGLTQKQLAKLVGRAQSVISRLEDADYEGHSFTMLQRIAGALGERITIGMTPADSARER
jgi:ribosome-binding protein aMBF1 (putative translation factor)